MNPKTFVSYRLGYVLDEPGLIPGSGRKGFFSLRQHVEIGPGDHAASCTVGTGDAFTRLKRPGRETDHSAQCSDEVTMLGAVP
jgi:hypothetical protein